MRIIRASVRGYRALYEVNLEIRGLNVLVGPNGAGKTSLLELFSLLSQAMQEALGPALSERGGIDQLLTRGRATSLTIEIAVDTDNPTPLIYKAELASTSRGFEIRREELTQVQKPAPAAPFVFLTNSPHGCLFHDPQARKLAPPDWNFKADELALAQVLRSYRAPEELRRMLASVALYDRLDVSRRAPVRLPQDLVPVSLPGPNGADLFAYLHNLRSTDEATFERLQDVLRSQFPGFRKLEFPVVGKGQAVLAWHDANGAPYYQNDLSEGTLRFIWLASVLLCPQLPTLTLIDEPEVSLHPELLAVIAALLQEASLRTQLLVATHSDRLIRWLNPGDIVLADKTDGAVALRRADSIPSIEAWMKEFTLDELWRMGELGART